MKSLQLALPDDLYADIGDDEMHTLAQEALLVRLYELGKIGSGRAALLLGTTRREFLVDVLGRYGESSFDEELNLAAEAARG